MNALPKPQPCGQNWLAMQPTANGRQCGQCEKEIYDFSTMSWPEIARTQAAHGNTLCGMYAPAQLAHWGQSPPAGLCTRLMAATTLALSLSTIPAPAQTAVVPAATTALTIRGTIRTTTAQGQSEPVPFATVVVVVEGTEIARLSDEQGHYELLIPAGTGASAPLTIAAVSLGFAKSEWELPPQSQGLVQHDILMEPDPNRISLSYFSVSKPSRLARTKWSLKRWFSKSPK
jgi:hypothetical protein